MLGPGGIFVIDTKNWSGKLSIDGRTLRQNGRSREPTVAACADSALAGAERMGPFGRHIQPVLCFVREEPLAGWAREVMICSTSNLTQMLTSRPSVLTPEELSQAWAVLHVELEPAAAPAASTVRHPRGPRAAARPSTSRSRRGRRASQPSVGRLVASLAMLGALLLWGPQLASVFGAVVAHQTTTAVKTDTPCPTAGAAAKHGAEAARDTAAKTRPDARC